MKNVLLNVALLLMVLGCGDDNGGATVGAGDTQTVPETGPVDAFAFELKRGQTISAAPFPNDLYLNDNGKIELGPLAQDPVIQALGKPEILDMFSKYIAERPGFGFSSSIYFFMSEAPDAESFKDKVSAIALSGPETGKIIPMQVFGVDDTTALGVFPKWGHYLMADSSYAVLIETGGTTATGRTILPSESFQALMAQDGDSANADLTAARERYKALREKLIADGTTDKYTIGTVFTTEPVFEHGRKLIDTVDAFTLEPATAKYRYDPEKKTFLEATVVEGEDALKAFFGTLDPMFAYNPGIWSGRSSTKYYTGYEKDYEGGTGNFRIGKVVAGSIMTPALNVSVKDGKAIATPLTPKDNLYAWTEKYLVPFTLYLCDNHVADPTNIPVALFNHGGGAIRGNAMGMVNANCASGVATVVADMIYHGGRRKTEWLSDGGHVVPTETDTFNFFSGQSEGDEGYVTDYTGDPGSSAASVAPLFAAEKDLDPVQIEANALQITVDSYTMLRMIKEGDWSQLVPGLSFNKDQIFHNTISFGTCYNTALDALVDDFVGLLTTVGASYVLSVNMPMAPGNALQASGILLLTFGLTQTPVELQAGAYQNPIVAIHQWLHERGDPIAWAPYVLRHRQFDTTTPALGTGNSWDETLHGPSQVTYNAALGLVPYTHGDRWTIDKTMPGADTVDAKPLEAPLEAPNLTYGDQESTGAQFFFGDSCHGLMVHAVCRDSFQHPYPPITETENKSTIQAPICEIHHQYKVFVDSILDGAKHPKIVVPEGTCEALYSE